MVIISDFLNEIYICIYSNLLLKELFGKSSVSKRNLRKQWLPKTAADTNSIFKATIDKNLL